MTIDILSKTTGYDRKRLWSIWQECVQNFVNDDAVSHTLDEEWKSFKEITMERDW